MYEITIKNTPETERFMKEQPAKYREFLLKGVKKAILFAEGEAKKSFNKPGNLHVRSGYLRRSIIGTVEDRYKYLVASLSSNVVYAAIHEYGGKIKAKNSAYLKFTVEGRWVTLKEVYIRPRPFLRPAVEKNLDKIEDIISETVTIGINK